MALVLFDVGNNFKPHLRLWVQIDGGDMVETVIDSYIRIKAKYNGKHICKIIYKVRDGHKTVAEHLIPILKDIIG